MVKVSIIIAAFNAAGHIRACLQSAITQTERDLEILVVDDCSEDDTVDVVRAASEADPRIKLLRTARNGGPSTARNVGLRRACGDWVAVLDADDTMDPDRLRTLLGVASRRKADMISDNLWLVVEGDHAAPTPMIPESILQTEHRLGLAEFIDRNVSTPKEPRFGYGFMKPMIRREFLTGHDIFYDEQVRFAEDFCLYVSCLRAGAVWWVTPRPLYRYLVRKHSLTEIQTSRDLNYLRTRQRALLAEPAVQADAPLRRAILRHLSVIDRNYYYRAFTDAVKAQEIGEALRLFFESARSTRLITLESARQAPRILVKALRGGYWPPVADAQE